MTHIEAGNPDNPPIILVHGMGTGASAWEPQLASLSEDYYVVAPFLPGYGEQEGRFSLEAARAVLKELVEGMNSSVHLCGLSLGALVALDFANAQPEYVSSLILSAGFVKLGDEMLEQQHQSAAYMRGFDPDTFQAEALPQLARDVPEPFKAQAIKEISLLTPESLASIFELDFDASAWIADIDKPALVLCGAEDKHNLELSKELAEQLPHARFELIPNAGHIANLDTPEVFTAELREFIGEQIP